jgi:EmrB/QacA subfamily drug resistance transporter
MAAGNGESAGRLRFDSPAGRWVVAAAVLGSGMATLDATVVNVALPSIARDLGADFGGLQWVVTGYTLTLASLLLVGGSLGDRFGRRRTFVCGVVWFAAASVLCAAAPNATVLVAARLLQGVGGALLTPGSLAVISASFHPDDRGRAVGAWSGLGGIAAALGPFLGGWLVQSASWRWIFLLNLPLAAVVVAVAVRHVPESSDPSANAKPVDVVGALAGSIGLAMTTYGLIQRTVPLAAGGVGVLAAFAVIEARRDNPMLPLDLFANRVFSAINALTFVIYGALGAVLFLISLTLQVGLGYPALRAGASLLPITVVMLALSSRSGALAGRIGPRLPLTLGPVVIGAGLVLLVRVQPGRPYASTVLPALVVFALGLALTVAPLTATVLAAAETRRAGVASAVNNAVARAGGLLAVASLPLLAGFDPKGRLEPAAVVHGLHAVAQVGAAACLVAGALGYVTMPSRRRDVAAGESAGRPTSAFHCPLDAPPGVLPAPTNAGGG